MARYLIYRGVDEEMILIEYSSYFAYTNMVFSRALFDAYLALYMYFHSTPTATIITNDFHMFG